MWRRPRPLGDRKQTAVCVDWRAGQSRTRTSPAQTRGIRREGRWRLWVEGGRAGIAARPLCNLKAARRAAPCRAMISHYSPLPFLARQPRPLLAKGLDVGFGCPLFPHPVSLRCANRRNRAAGRRRREGNGSGGGTRVFGLLLMHRSRDGL